MKSFIQMLVDNSAAVLAWLLSLVGLLTLFGLDLSKDQIAGIMTFAGATIGLLAGFITVAKRKVVSLLPAEGEAVVAGPAAAEMTGSPVPTASDSDGNTVAFATVPLAA